MNLTSDDYKSLIYSRTDKVRSLLWPQHNAPQPIGGQNHYVSETPNFVQIRELIEDISALLEDYETSIGPA